MNPSAVLFSFLSCSVIGRRKLVLPPATSSDILQYFGIVTAVQIIAFTPTRIEMNDDRRQQSVLASTNRL